MNRPSPRSRRGSSKRVTACPMPNSPMKASGSEDEVEARELAGVADLHDEMTIEDAVALVQRLTWKVELRGQHAPVWCLHVDVEVPRPPGIDAGHDGLEPVAAGVVGELVAAQPEAGVVVIALRVGLPEVHQRPRDRLAVRGEDSALHDDPRARRARLEE